MEEQKVEQNVPVTEVTSIANEEKKTGQKIAVPGPDDLVAKASVSMMQCKRALVDVVGQMSKKQMRRAVAASCDLPTEGLPVLLKTDLEKKFYVYSQRLSTDKFIIIQDHINKQLQEQRAEMLKKQQEQASEQVVPDTTENTTNTTEETKNE